MQHAFVRGKGSIARREGLERFEQGISGLTNDGYLSLLLRGVIEHGLAPFPQYLQLLLKQGADINFTQPTKKANLLMRACLTAKLHVVEELLKQQDIRVFQKDRMRKNAVHYAIENASQEDALEIVEFVMQKYPQFRSIAEYEKGSYFTLAIEACKPSILQYLISEEIDCDHLKSESTLLILHRVVEQHKRHRRIQRTISILRVLLAAGCREDALNDKEENYLSYAINRGLMSEQEVNQLLRQLKPQNEKKQLTLQTSPEQKVADFQQEQDFSDNSEQEHDIEVFFQSQQPYQPSHMKISQQMYKIAMEVQQVHSKTWVVLYPFYLKLYGIVSQLYGSIELIGSFASNLWIPNCDIDFLLIIPQNNVYFFDDIVHAVFSKVKKLGGHTHIKLYLAYKLPMIKLILGKEYGELEVQLFLSNKKNIATQYVSFVHEIMVYYPEIQVIYYVIRKLLEVKSLHDHKTGGLKAYGLFLLIYTMRNHYKYSYVSQFLQHFAYYYGIDYEYVGEMVGGEVSYKINIMDPLNSENNMGGKKTNILSLKEVFKKVYYGLNMENEGGKIAFLMGLISDI